MQIISHWIRHRYTNVVNSINLICLRLDNDRFHIITYQPHCWHSTRNQHRRKPCRIWRQNKRRSRMARTTASRTMSRRPNKRHIGKIPPKQAGLSYSSIIRNIQLVIFISIFYVKNQFSKHMIIVIIRIEIRRKFSSVIKRELFYEHHIFLIETFVGIEIN